MRTQHSRGGFTFIELLISIGFIALMMALLVPAIQKARASAARTDSHNNMKQLGLGLHTCNDTYQRIPPATGPFGPIAAPNPLSIHMLTFIGQDNLYKDHMSGVAQPAVVPTYLSAMDPTHTSGVREQNFVANVRVFTSVGQGTQVDKPVSLTSTFGEPNIPRSFPDGISSTMMFSTRYTTTSTGAGDCSAYDSALNPKSSSAAFFGGNPLPATGASPTSTGGFQITPTRSQANCNSADTAHSYELGGIYVTMADGSVRTVAPTITPTTWNSAMQPNDNLPLGRDWDMTND